MLVAASCSSGGGGASGPRTLDAQLGGGTTRADTTRNAFGLSAANLSDAERRRFEIGNSFFTSNWVIAPSSTDARDGLGPTLNAQACSSCHLLDGRGAPTDVGDGLLLRLSVPGRDPRTGAPVPEPTYEGQLQDRSILDVPAEGKVEVTYASIPGTFGDGTAFELRQPTFRIVDLAFGPLAPGTMVGPRLAPQVIGMGLLEAVPEATIVDRADPDDEDGNGNSGRANTVWDERAGAPALGRFGWKANVATVEQQVASAFHGDIGITSSLHPAPNCPPPQAQCAAAISGGEPEITDERLGNVTFYNRTLAVPALRGPTDASVLAGAKVFDDLGCSDCHTETLKTGASDIATLADQTIHPYTDLLLHDMGAGLADGRPDFQASGSEWRTPPLWGLGLIDDVGGRRFLLHDGRARTIAEAILWHGGEADASKERFRLAPARDRDALLAFLEAL
jgi:CxxC motif-containing protein (DUF1111 family)